MPSLNVLNIANNIKILNANINNIFLNTYDILNSGHAVSSLGLAFWPLGFDIIILVILRSLFSSIVTIKECYFLSKQRHVRITAPGIEDNAAVQNM